MSLTKQQLVQRKKGLFGTDASATNGTNEYHDAFWLYKTKRCEWSDVLPPAIHLELGHELEDYVARKYCELKRVKVRKCNRTVWSKKHLYEGQPFIGAHVDRMVVGKKKILECKTAYSRTKWGTNGSGQIPSNYRSQIMHYCLVLGLHKVDLAVLHLPFPPKLDIHSFDFSQMELNDLLEKEYHIWDCIQRGIEPEVGGGLETGKQLREEWAESESDVVVSTLGVNKDVVTLATIKADIKSLTSEKTQHINRIMHHMKEKESLVNHEGDQIASFKPDSRGVRKLIIK